jgi:hypothetical protein
MIISNVYASFIQKTHFKNVKFSQKIIHAYISTSYKVPQKKKIFVLCAKIEKEKSRANPYFNMKSVFYTYAARKVGFCETIWCAHGV